MKEAHFVGVHSVVYNYGTQFTDKRHFLRRDCLQSKNNFFSFWRHWKRDKFGNPGRMWDNGQQKATYISQRSMLTREEPPLGAFLWARDNCWWEIKDSTRKVLETPKNTNLKRDSIYPHRNNLKFDFQQKQRWNVDARSSTTRKPAWIHSCLLRQKMVRSSKSKQYGRCVSRAFWILTKHMRKGEIPGTVAMSQAIKFLTDIEPVIKPHPRSSSGTTLGLNLFRRAKQHWKIRMEEK